MRFSIFILSSFFLFSSCQNDFEKMKGHWHFENQHSESYVLGQKYFTIDFMKDTLAVLNNQGHYSGIWGYVDHWSNQIYLGGECIHYNFQYTFSGEQLLIKDTEEGSFIGKKCEENCCDKQKDYFLYQPFLINLPVISDTSKLNLKNPKASLQQNYYFGIPKEKHQLKFGYSHLLSLGNKIISDSLNLEIEIPLYIEKHKIKSPEHFHTRIRPTIFADKNTSISKFRIPFQILQKSGYKHICFATRKPFNTDFEFEIGYRCLKFKNINLEKEILFEEWINQ